jgi:hypothetical protein
MKNGENKAYNTSLDVSYVLETLYQCRLKNQTFMLKNTYICLSALEMDGYA